MSATYPSACLSATHTPSDRAKRITGNKKAPESGAFCVESGSNAAPRPQRLEVAAAKQPIPKTLRGLSRLTSRIRTHICSPASQLWQAAMLVFMLNKYGLQALTVKVNHLL
jgi:hypothetical protein